MSSFWLVFKRHWLHLHGLRNAGTLLFWSFNKENIKECVCKGNASTLRWITNDNHLITHGVLDDLGSKLVIDIFTLKTENNLRFAYFTTLRICFSLYHLSDMSIAAVINILINTWTLWNPSDTVTNTCNDSHLNLLTDDDQQSSHLTAKTNVWQ